MPSNALVSPFATAREDELWALAAGGEHAKVRAAQAELYDRHVRYLYGILCRKSARLLELGGIGAEDLVHDTFERAFERASTFTPAPEADADLARRRTRAWLGRIAGNLLADRLRRDREIPATPAIERVAFDERDSSPPPARLDRVRAALSELSEREQDVLRVTALHLRATGHPRLPNAVCSELAARWGITAENVRAVRSRAMRKLLARLAEGGAEPTEGP